MSDEAAIFGLASLILGGVVDYFVTEPFFLSLVSSISFAGWNPLTVFVYLYGIPYATSVAAVAGIIGAILGAASGGGS